jgi:acid phosphatase type 7
MNNDFQNAEHLEPSLPGDITRTRKRRFVTLLTVFVLLAVTLQTLYLPPLEASAASVVLVGAGDIASCSYDSDEATAKLLDGIPGTVFTTGDNAYERGTYTQFSNCYHPTWGRHQNRTKPVPGNHEYKNSGAAGYFKYFSDIPSYYAYNLGDWRIYALNSEIDVSPTSAQVRWLKKDLAANPKLCVLAYWHRPRWSSGNHHGGDPRYQPFWNTLYKAGTELVINGHEHHYERFTQMNAFGAAVPQGLREIVVGTGGASLYGFGSIRTSSEAHNAQTHGVLKLALHTDSYSWKFIPVAGKTFTDKGTTSCH